MASMSVSGRPLKMASVTPRLAMMPFNLSGFHADG